MEKEEIIDQIERWELKDLKGYDNNPVDHPGKQKKMLKKLVKDVGFLDPILVDGRTGEIIDGHLRLEVAEDLDMDEVSVIPVEHLSDEEVKATRIAVQKMAYEADFNTKKLAQEFMDLSDIGMDVEKSGFNAEEVKDTVKSYQSMKRDLGMLENEIEEGEAQDIDFSDVEDYETSSTVQGEGEDKQKGRTFITIKFRIDRAGQDEINNILRKHDGLGDSRGDTLLRLVQEGDKYIRGKE